MDLIIGYQKTFLYYIFYKIQKTEQMKRLSTQFFKYIYFDDKLLKK